MNANKLWLSLMFSFISVTETPTSQNLKRLHEVCNLFYLSLLTGIRYLFIKEYSERSPAMIC